MVKKTFFWLFMLTILPGMIFGFLSVRILHAKELLNENDEDRVGASAGSLFLGYSASWAFLIYAVLSYFIFA